MHILCKPCFFTCHAYGMIEAFNVEAQDDYHSVQAIRYFITIIKDYCSYIYISRRIFKCFNQRVFDIGRVQSCVWRTPLLRGRTHSPGGEGGGGSIFWKTRDIGLASYSNNLSTILIIIIFFRTWRTRKTSSSKFLSILIIKIIIIIIIFKGTVRPDWI